MKTRGPSFTQEEIVEYARQIQAGKTFLRIAKKTGRSPKALAKHVWRYLSEHDHKIPGSTS